MLQLGSRMQTIEGVTVFPDHADERQAWYLPAHISLARRPEDNRPAFTFLKYKRAATASGVEGGGFLMFAVELGLPEEVEQAIRSELPAGTRLSAVPFDTGTVECVALNLQGPGGTVATVGDNGTFIAVEQILGASMPSLFGNNTAMFSLTLSQEGATLLEQAFAAGATPIGVIYKLSFTAMQEALNVKITADFERIYRHFSMGLNANVYYVELGIEVGIEELVQAGAIKIEVTNFSTDDDKAEQEQQAISFFKDHLLSKWFEPTLQPGALQGGMAQAPRAGGGAALFGPGRDRSGDDDTAGGSNGNSNGSRPGRGNGRPPTPPPPPPPPGSGSNMGTGQQTSGGNRPPNRPPTAPGRPSGGGPTPPPAPNGGPGRPTGPTGPTGPTSGGQVTGGGTTNSAGPDTTISFIFSENGGPEGVHGRFEVVLTNGGDERVFRTDERTMASDLEVTVPRGWDRCEIVVQALTLPVIELDDAAQLRNMAGGSTSGMISGGRRPGLGSLVFDELSLGPDDGDQIDVRVSLPITETRFIAADADALVNAVLPNGQLAQETVYDVRRGSGTNEYVMISVGDPDGIVDQRTGDQR